MPTGKRLGKVKWKGEKGNGKVKGGLRDKKLNVWKGLRKEKEWRDCSRKGEV